MSKLRVHNDGRFADSTAVRMGAMNPWDPIIRGLCVGKDPEIWFPTRAENADKAFSICARCPLRRDCLSVGVKRKETGVWGGAFLVMGKVVASVDDSVAV